MYKIKCVKTQQQMVTDASNFVDFVFIRCGPRKRNDLL